MQLYVGDYLRDTRHLSAEQHGAYLLLLMSMWAHGGTLPNDPKKLARIASCTASRWAKIGDDVLAFFEVDGDEITQSRLREEYKKALEKSIKRAEAGMRGGEAKARKSKETGLANASRLPCHSPEPEPEDTPSVTIVPEGGRAPRKVKRCPVDWSPSEEDRAVVFALGFSAGELERELAMIRDHQFRDAHSDWSAVFRNWFRREAKRKPRQANDRPAPSSAKFDAKRANHERALRAFEAVSRGRSRPNESDFLDPLGPDAAFGGGDGPTDAPPASLDPGGGGWGAPGDRTPLRDLPATGTG